jgi:hypothetical protein
MNMRRNVIAIRKTIISNKRLGKQVDTKIKLQDEQLKETQKRAEVERERERKRSVRVSIPKLSLLNPERAFSILSSNPVVAVITFFSFALVGWMLKALPALQTAVSNFIKRAQSFLVSLTGFWNNIKTFFGGIFKGLKIAYEALIGGIDFFVPGKVDDIKDKFRELQNKIKEIITDIPKKVTNFIKGLLGLHKKVGDRVKAGQTPEEALRDETSQINYTPIIESRADQIARAFQAGAASNVVRVVKPDDTQNNYFARKEIPGLNISTRSLGEVRELLKTKKIEGAGAYAIDLDTLEYLLASGRFKEEDPFNADVQFRMFQQLAIIKLAGVRNYLKTPRSNDPEKEQQRLSVAISEIITELPLLLNYGETTASGLEALENVLREYRKSYQQFINRKAKGTNISSLINTTSVQTVAFGNGRQTKIVNVKADIPIPNGLQRKIAAKLNKGGGGGYSAPSTTVVKQYPLSDTPYTQSAFA